MPWVRFTGRFDDRPHKRQVVVYRAGMRRNVTRRTAEAAIAAGKAERIETPTRDEARRWAQES